MKELMKLPNIGDAIAGQLMDIGVENLQQLQEIGAKKAWLAIQKDDPTICFSRLCALQGAIEGVRWFNLSQPTKENLKLFYNNNKI